MRQYDLDFCPKLDGFLNTVVGEFGRETIIVTVLRVPEINFAARQTAFRGQLKCVLMPVQTFLTTCLCFNYNENDTKIY